MYLEVYRNIEKYREVYRSIWAIREIPPAPCEPGPSPPEKEADEASIPTANKNNYAKGMTELSSIGGICCGMLLL